MSGGARPGQCRALRYGAGTAAVVVLICALVVGCSARTWHTVGARVAAATARGHGEVIRAGPRDVAIRWSDSGVWRTDTVRLATQPPPVGTRTELIFDPQQPSRVFLPGTADLAAMDRAASGVSFGVLTTATVLVTLGWQLVTRRRLVRRAGHPAVVRRVRIQSGLLTRSWLEVDPRPQRWIPVHFDPVLTTLPAPALVRLHGDPQRHRLIAAEVNGVWLYPSGRVRSREPPGRRRDSPAQPDASPLSVTGWRRQLRADAALTAPAPVVGLLWAYLAGGGLLTWTCATALTAALALCWAALRGSDPS